MRNTLVEIIAGPCSIDKRNRADVDCIAKTGIVTKVRFVPAKSRTVHSSDNFEGIDADILNQKIRGLAKTGTINKKPLPSVKWAEKFRRAHPGIGLALEIVSPVLQLPCYANTNLFGSDALFIWSPAAQQLGWPIRTMGEFADRHKWTLGIKNGKWVETVPESNKRASVTDVEKTWQGLSTWATGINRRGRNVLIHRGFNAGSKNGNFRNLPIHEIAMRLKQKTNMAMFFDPSHSFGPRLRNKIVDGTLVAMDLTLPNGEYLYDGILIEVAGKNGVKTDAKQHISITELETLANKLSSARGIIES